MLTALVELDLARERRSLGHSNAHLFTTLARTMRNTIIHPVVLPVLAGLAWNLARAPAAIADEILATLAQAVVPLCPVLIGMSLAYYGVKGAARGAVVISVLQAGRAAGAWCWPRRTGASASPACRWPWW